MRNENEVGFSDRETPEEEFSEEMKNIIASFQTGRINNDEFNKRVLAERDSIAKQEEEKLDLVPGIKELRLALSEAESDSVLNKYALIKIRAEGIRNFLSQKVDFNTEDSAKKMLDNLNYDIEQIRQGIENQK